MCVCLSTEMIIYHFIESSVEEHVLIKNRVRLLHFICILREKAGN